MCVTPALPSCKFHLPRVPQLSTCVRCRINLPRWMPRGTNVRRNADADSVADHLGPYHRAINLADPGTTDAVADDLGPHPGADNAANFGTNRADRNPSQSSSSDKDTGSYLGFIIGGAVWGR